MGVAIITKDIMHSILVNFTAVTHSLIPIQIGAKRGIQLNVARWWRERKLPDAYRVRSRKIINNTAAIGNTRMA